MYDTNASQRQSASAFTAGECLEHHLRVVPGGASTPSAHSSLLRSAGRGDLDGGPGMCGSRQCTCGDRTYWQVGTRLALSSTHRPRARHLVVIDGLYFVGNGSSSFFALSRSKVTNLW
jgi:hypothetical protein